MKNNIIFICTMLFFFSGCSDVLEKYPLDKPAQETFYTNANEIRSGINACYRFLMTENDDRSYIYPIVLDCMSDVGFPRQDTDAKYIAKGEHNSRTGTINTAYNRAYMGIGRCNTMLQVMEEKASLLTDAQNKQFKGEALFLRAYYYMKLVIYFGDVPLVTAPVKTIAEASTTMRTPKEQVIEQILADFTEAAGLLEPSYSANADKGRATRGAANALKARAALIFGKYDVAAVAAKTVMESGVYQLYPKYGNLFLPAGLWDTNNKELILMREFSGAISDYHNMPQYLLTRNTGGWACLVPSQSMIDSYDCADGKNITESPLFDKANPFENRDPRLKLSFLTPGERFGNFHYESHYDSTTCLNYATGARVTNNDCYQINQYTSYTGYYPRKYSDVNYSNRLTQGDYPLIICRYGEVLLTYAEAKVELNQIDQSVADALNSIRRDRDDVKMPEYTLADLGNQNTARLKVRHERKIELAFEGFRYTDIRRWGWAAKYANQPILGRPFMGSYTDWPRVTFDENGEPQYPGNESYMPHPSKDYRIVELRLFTVGKHELWPIPEREKELNPGLAQNTGY